MTVGWINTLDGIYREYGRELVTYARSVTGCLDLAEDAVHEAFARLFELTRIPDHPRNYVFRTVRNASIDCLKKSDRRHLSLAESGDANQGQSSSADQLAEDAETIQLAHDALESLPRDQREVITLRLRVGMTFREIAQMLERPQGTVATHYRRGLEAMRTRLEPDDART